MVLRQATAVTSVVGVLVALGLVGHGAAQTPRRPGHIKGTVKLTGTAALLQGFPSGADEMVCGKEVPEDSLVVGKNGALQGVVMFLDLPREGREPGTRRSPALEIKNCRFQPRVVSMTVGDELVLGSADDLFHNVLAFHHGVDGQGPGRTLFNLAFPPGSQRVKVRARESGFMVLRGQLTHPWIRGVVRVFDHPHHAVTKADGTFEINGVPPGSYTLHAWHERLGTQDLRVEVQPSSNTRPTIEFAAQPLRTTPWEVERVAVSMDAGVVRPPASIVGAADGGAAPVAPRIRVSPDAALPQPE